MSKELKNYGFSNVVKIKTISDLVKSFNLKLKMKLCGYKVLEIYF